MNIYYIIRTTIEDGDVYITVGDVNDHKFEKQYEIHAESLVANKQMIEIAI